jgi:hypothetical protein
MSIITVRPGETVTVVGIGGDPGGGSPGGPGGGLGIWGPPQMPPGFWGGGMGPGVKPQPPGSPGQPPLGIWGGGNVPMPTPPIYFPPPGSQPPLGIWGGRPPNYVDIGGPGPQPRPEHPIVLPPDLPPEIPPPNGGGSPIPIDWKTGWTEQTGWIIVGVPGGTHPTPSK